MDARPLADTSLPTVDVPPIPGAALALRRGLTAEGGVELLAVCARAPSDRWAPGVEELVLGRATGIARGALQAEVDRFDTSAITTRAV